MAKNLSPKRQGSEVSGATKRLRDDDGSASDDNDDISSDEHSILSGSRDQLGGRGGGGGGNNDDGVSSTNIGSASEAGDDQMDELARLRKQKRLAMNRMTARARRRNQKVRLETLEQQVVDMKERYAHCQVDNRALTNRVAELESDLAKANSTILTLMGQQSLSLQQQHHKQQQQHQLELSERAKLLASLSQQERATGFQSLRVPDRSLDNVTLGNLLRSSTHSLSGLSDRALPASAIRTGITDGSASSSYDLGLAGSLPQRGALDIQAVLQGRSSDALTRGVVGRLDHFQPASRQNLLGDVSALLPATSINTPAAPPDYLTDLRLGAIDEDTLRLAAAGTLDARSAPTRTGTQTPRMMMAPREEQHFQRDEGSSHPGDSKLPAKISYKKFEPKKRP